MNDNNAMTVWTTYAPGKVCWELTSVQSKGKAATNSWKKHLPLIEDSLKKLKNIGIAGIRLVIYPSEITKDGKAFNWEPLEIMLDLCQKNTLDVDLCIGPYQFPHYPGIFLPDQMKQYISDNQPFLDDDETMREYGCHFLKTQMKRYADDVRIHGFHFANEWPDFQRVAGKESIRIGVSESFMLQAAAFLKQATKKPILMNTNIDAANKNKLTRTFSNILTILGHQAKLGFDIYPSQETWKKAPVQKLRRIVEPYQKSFAWAKKTFPACEMYFTEVEAQPWGNGQSWYRIISNATDPQKSIIGFTPQSLAETWEKHIKATGCKTVMLWGSDFWLSADAMNLTWPLRSVEKLRE
jgi:hypothetical protein